MHALDSDGWLDLARAKAWGATAVGLYLAFNLTQAQADTAASLDLGLWCFFERQSWDPDGGAPQGVIDANAAADHADKLSGVKGAAIYLPNDQVVTNWPATLAYFEAAAQTLRSRGYAPGIYGQESLWQKIRQWYEYFCHAPDGTNPPYPGANIIQNVAPQITIGTVSCDVDLLMTPKAFGGWNAEGLWPKPPPPIPEDLPVLFIAVANATGSPQDNTQGIVKDAQYLIDTQSWNKRKLALDDAKNLTAALKLGPPVSLGPFFIAGFPG